MSTNGDGIGQSSTGPTMSSLSHLPWNMIPVFKPGETEINEYAKKLEFLASLWPPEHLSHLSSRAAMLCEGSAFKKVMRIAPEKLKVNSVDGVKLLVQTLGGIWGKSNLEEKFERFERAIFSTSQRSDESHESYLARHDYQFEELLQMGVGFEEIRAYVLLRNSGLGPEDKKKLIVDADGDLKYKNVVSSLKLLGSRFFHELQSGSKSLSRSKTYDVNAVFEDEVHGEIHDDDVAFVGDTWEDLEPPWDENDPDAIVCLQFEDSLVEALQSDGELAACYNTYLDARKRLSDRNKNRGFWGNSKGFSSGSKGKGKNKGKWGNRFRKPLAQRILESECRRCGQKGHWKAECPLARSSSSAHGNSSQETGAFAGTLDVLSAEAESDMILISHDAQVSDDVQRNVSVVHECYMGIGSKMGIGKNVEHPNVSQVSGPMMSRFVRSLKTLLSPHSEKPNEPSVCVDQPRPDSTETSDVQEVQEKPADVALFVSHGPYGIMDLGASQTVIGRQQVPELFKHLPDEVSRQVQTIPCQTVFRFGNSSTVSCREALLIPLNQWNVKVCIVESKTPFLISNNVFRTLGAMIDTAQDTVLFSKIQISMPLMLTEKKLYLIDFCELIRRAQVKVGKEGHVMESHVRPVMNTVSEEPENLQPDRCQPS